MSDPLPALFISHGSPMLALDKSAAHHFLKGLSDLVPKPKNILMVSAHWETAVPSVSTAQTPETIHDFGGFARELFAMRYPAPGAPDLARRTAQLLEEAGHAVEVDPSRGFDHGAWVPMTLIYPEAGIPMTQLSVQPHLGPEHHLAIGQALQPLREEGTLIIGSGAMTHNLEAFFKGGFKMESEPPEWVRAFAEWAAQALEEGRIDDLVHYRERAPFGAENHPTEEHFLPLFVAVGAASSGMRADRLHKSDAYGVIAMDVYAMA